MMNEGRPHTVLLIPYMYHITLVKYLLVAFCVKLLA